MVYCIVWERPREHLHIDAKDGGCCAAVAWWAVHATHSLGVLLFTQLTVNRRFSSGTAPPSSHSASTTGCASCDCFRAGFVLLLSMATGLACVAVTAARDCVCGGIRLGAVLRWANCSVTALCAVADSSRVSEMLMLPSLGNGARSISTSSAAVHVPRAGQSATPYG